MKEFQGKVAVITGAAGTLGRAFAATAAGLGMKLVLADVLVHPLEHVSEELHARGAEVLAMVCDVRKGRLVQELADAAVARFGSVHLVINNARCRSGGLVWENTEADWESGLGVNLWGPVHCARIFSRLMLDCAKRHPGYEGHFVDMASLGGLANPPAMALDNLSTHAALALAESLYHDFRLVEAPIGVSVALRRPEEETAGELARLTFDAIRDGHFYIISHPDDLNGLPERTKALVRQQVPPDPYGETPHIRDMLRSRMK